MSEYMTLTTLRHSKQSEVRLHRSKRSDEPEEERAVEKSTSEEGRRGRIKDAKEFYGSIRTEISVLTTPLESRVWSIFTI